MNCTFTGCINKQLARGYCNKHYKQMRTSGQLNRKYHHEFHGMHGTPEHWAWAHLIQRCFNKNDKRYADWGGRGITVCENYRYSFLAFFDDLGLRPTDMMVDRIDNDAHYSCGKCGQCIFNGWKANVRWASSSEQQINKRVYATNSSGYKNITWNKRQQKWCVAIERHGKPIFTGSYAKVDEAVQARDKALMVYNGTHGK